MNCIICDKTADETGSHIVPASLIKNCIGKHYEEESYEIDLAKATVDIYFGRDNNKNKNPKIKKHHYKEDRILCKSCEKKLSILENKFSTEFLQKFRNEKFKNNFNNYSLNTKFEIIEPKKINNIEILAYIYSIILRFCRDAEKENQKLVMLTENELTKIKSFLNGFLYQQKTDYFESISNFNLILVFDKYSDKGSFIFGLEESINPYIFFFCEVIVLLFTNDVSDEIKFHFKGCLNSTNESTGKIIVGPSEFYQELILTAQNVVMKEMATNVIKRIMQS